MLSLLCLSVGLFAQPRMDPNLLCNPIKGWAITGSHMGYPPGIQNLRVSWQGEAMDTYLGAMALTNQWQAGIASQVQLTADQQLTVGLHWYAQALHLHSHWVLKSKQVTWHAQWLTRGKMNHASLTSISRMPSGWRVIIASAIQANQQGLWTVGVASDNGPLLGLYGSSNGQWVSAWQWDAWRLDIGFSFWGPWSSVDYLPGLSNTSKRVP